MFRFPQLSLKCLIAPFFKKKFQDREGVTAFGCHLFSFLQLEQYLSLLVLFDIDIFKESRSIVL